MSSKEVDGAGRTLIRALSLACLVVIWQIGAAVAHSPVLPSPGAVLAFVVAEATGGDLLRQLGITLFRVAASFTIAMLIGSAIGIALGRSHALNLWFDSWLAVLLNMPALVIAVLAYVWFGLTEAAAIGAVALNKIPTVAVTLREGTRALDPALDEMAKVYRFSWRNRLVHVTLPALSPFFAAAARSGLALVWKIVLFVELLGRPNGIGFAIQLNFQLFNLTAVLGYSLAFVAVMLAIEYLVMEPLERNAQVWRRR
jgi:NitT/TauT family transport system permease protein